MIPKRLIIQGLFSYQAKQEIDFTKLTSNDLFGIFGKVGSGKSSIIDAISYALYDNLEKLNQRDNTSYNLMNLKSNKMYIDFWFENYDGKEYRFEVEARRNSKNFNDISFKNRQQYVLENGVWQPKELKADEVLGLSYNNFKRTVIIPQGKFMDFLQLGDKERTNMLKEIFNLRKFDLSAKVSELEKQNNLKLSEISGKLSNYQDVDKETIEQKKVKHKEETGKLIVLEKEIEETQKKLNEQEELKKLFDEKEVFLKQQAKLNEKSEYFKQVEQKIKLSEEFVSIFQTDVYKRKSVEVALNEGILKYDNTLKKVQQINEQLLKYKPKFEAISVENSKLSEYKELIEDYKKAYELKNNEQKILNSEKELQEIKEKYEELSLQSEDIKKTIKNSENQLDTTRKFLKDISELYGLKNWFIKKQELENQLDKLEKEIKSLDAYLKQLNADKLKSLPEEILTKLGITNNHNFDEIFDIISNNLRQGEELFEKLSLKKDKLKVKLQLSHYTKNLEEGKACPVCGSTSHPKPAVFDEVNTELEKVEKRISNGKIFIENVQKIEKILQKKHTEFNIKTEDLKQKNKEFEKLKNELETYLKSFKSEYYKTPDFALLEKDIKETETKNEKIKELEKEIKQQNSNLDKTRQKTDVLKEQINSKKIEIESLKTTRQVISEQIKHIEDFESLSQENLLQNIKHQEEKIRQIDKDYKKYKELVEKLGNEQIRLDEALKNTEEANEKLKKELSDLNKNIEGKISNSHFFNTEKELIKFSEEKIDITALRKEFSDYEKLKQEVEINLNNIEKLTAGKKFDKSLFENLSATFNNLQAKKNDLLKQVGALKSEIEKLNNQLKEKKELETEQEKLTKRAENIKILKDLFKAQGFVKFVSTIFLEQLVNYANKRFRRLTKNNLSLVLNEKNNFDIIDYLNDGKQRSVKTLSGGQTFQASLSLALALAGSIHSQNKSSKNFFFLDEGFGTQDNESLQIIFETLKSLKEENRIVGIISHVDELKESINTYLHVENTSDKGSIIKTSW